MTTTAMRFQYEEQQNEQETVQKEPDFASFIDSINVECEIRVGTLNINVGDLKHLAQGQILQLNEKTSESVDILLNKKIIARGELVCCNEYFGIKITEVS
ncbi:hypothetical protein E3983_06225 [Legionella israelensis]|uniref:Flagellar motor switch protein FliN n=1 Tax=Legionella israelensis TaxID=454 RepID=A0AAX1EFR7_9GAMM|nr:FliM/FliN family flagellar motor switch protein [Legionella israelensis]QBR83981.1 hypothetical protein E3983_06225 [Legionella israelensis]